MPNTRTEHRPGRILKYSAALLVVALLAYAGFLVSQSWREAKSGQARQLETIAALSENSINIYFTQLQIGMLNLSADIAVTSKKADLDHAFEQVSRFQMLHTELSNVMLIRADGQILMTGTTPNGPGLPTLAADPAFKVIRNELLQGGAFVVSRPVRGHIDKSWVVSARYAVTDLHGKLVYIISANLPVDMLQRYWIDATTPKITALGLVRDDGYLVSFYPEPDEADRDTLYGKKIGEALAFYPLTTDQSQREPIEIFNGDTNTTSLLAMRRLQHYPLTLFVEAPLAEVRAAWWRDMHAPYFLMALVLACTFVFYGLRNHRRAWSVEKRRKELQRHYEQTLREHSPSEIFMFDTDTLQISFVNDYAQENLGYTQEQLQQKTILALQPETSIESFGARVDMLRLGERDSIIYETVQARADGSLYPVEVTLQLIKSEEGVERCLAIAHDLSARKEAEENIRKFNAPVERRGGR
jgi:PAS domain S-box-containing protein